jgi:CBS domain containing-hemolysin-like protein/mannitol/fructose-specific phosphotransferase system IIA component (Ntr-type)
MTHILFYLLLAVLLLLLNAFFVLAEFAIVKARPTQMEALAAKGNRLAKRVLYIQTHIDQFLSVCQIGITLASIGLGFVGEPSLAALIKPVMERLGTGTAANIASHGAAVLIAYVLISYLHIVLGEQVPKCMAIRRTDKAALFTVYPLLVCYYLFFFPLWLLNISVNAVLYLLRIPPIKGHTLHSEDEIRIILDQSQSSGMMSFRRLLYIENVLDMSELVVRNAMQPRGKTRFFSETATREEIDACIAKYRYSRYPVVSCDTQAPLGYIHVKDLYLADSSGKKASDIKTLIRPALQVKEGQMLEEVLSEMQRKGNHVGFVFDENKQWTGIITLEDVLEEVVGTIEEEFPVEPSVALRSSLSSAAQIVLDVEGDTIITSTRNTLSRLAPGVLPLPLDEIMPHIAQRERAASSYVGKRLAIPHARLKNISRPVVVVARLKSPIAAPGLSGGRDMVHFLFIVLTPADAPRVHQIILARIAGLFESGFFETRMDEAGTPQELFDAIGAVEQATDLRI